MDLSDELEELGVVYTPRRLTYQQLCNDMKQREVLSKRAKCDVKGTRKQTEARRKRLLRAAQERGVRYEFGDRSKERELARDLGIESEGTFPFYIPELEIPTDLLQSVIEATPELQLSAEERQKRIAMRQEQLRIREEERIAALKEAQERMEQQRVLREQQAEQLRREREQRAKELEAERLERQRQAQERQAQEAERLRLERERREQARREAEAERMRLKQEREFREKEAEAERKAKEAERRRLMEERQRELEAQRKAQEEEQRRLQEERQRESEAKRQSQEAERRRLQQETEAKRQSQEAERLRLARESEAQREAQLREQERKAKEEEAKEAERKRKMAEAQAKRDAEYKAMREREKREGEEKFQREMAELEKRKQAILAAGIEAEKKETEKTAPAPSPDTYSVLSIKEKEIQILVPLNAVYPVKSMLWLSQLIGDVPHSFGQQTKVLSSAPEDNILRFTLNPDSDVNYLAQMGHIDIREHTKDIIDISFDAGGQNIKIMTHCDRLQKTLTNPSNAAGTSCFADSVIVSLFAIDDSIVDQQFLKKEPANVECDPTLSPEQVSKIKIDLVKALKNYVKVIRSPPNEGDFKTQECLNIRRLVAQCRPTFKDVGPTPTGKFSVADSTEFWNGLASVFDVQPMRVNITKFSSENDVRKYLTSKTIAVLKGMLEKRSLSTQGKKAELISRLTPVLMKETKRSETRQQATVSVTKETEGHRVGHILQEKHAPEDNPSFSRLAEIVDADFLVFDLARYEYDDQGKMIWSDQKYEFVPTLSLVNGSIYHLQSFVALSGAESYPKGKVLGVGHYVAYVRCGAGKWLKFDDLAGPVPQLLPQRPAAQLEKASVLAFYTKK